MKENYSVNGQNDNFLLSFDEKKLLESLGTPKYDRKGNAIGFKEVKPIEASKLLIQHSDLKYCKFFPKSGLIYLYQSSVGVYKRVTHKELKIYISSVFESMQIVEMQTNVYVNAVYKNLELRASLVVTGDVTFDTGFMVFQNGLLNMKTLKLGSWSPDVFMDSFLPFKYEPRLKTPNFDRFLDEFTLGHQDRKNFIRSFFYAVLFQKVELQVFMYLYGPGGSGKSTFGNIISAMVGTEGVHSTTLRALDSDQFEIANLLGKKLILISDTEEYHNGMSVLKAYTGNDTLRGRFMHTQGTTEIRAQGMVLVIGNNAFHCTDASNALLRRIRVLKTSKSYQTREPLLAFVNGAWEGLLAQELSGIIHLALSCPDSFTKQYITQFHINVPSLAEANEETKDIVSPMDNWLQAEVDYVVDKGDNFGSYLGYNPKTTAELVLSKERKLLYPAYLAWCKRNTFPVLGHNKFSSHLMMCCTNKGFLCKKIRKASGFFITHLTLKDVIFTQDYMTGAPADISSVSKKS